MKTYDGSDVYCYLWDDVVNPKGVIQIIHGMAEHAKRYEDFAKKLNQAGYIVFADDHRAHGKTSKNNVLGTYIGNDIFFDTVNDEIYFAKSLRKMYPNLPLIIFGHSYGSFLTQALITRYQDYDKIILSGSALMKGRIDILFGQIIAWFTCFRKSADAPAKAIIKASFGKYQKQVKTGSWITSDKAEADKYFADPYCGFPLSAGFYRSFFNAFGQYYDQQYASKININKPIFIISGQDDPVGSMGKSVVKLCKYYSKLGILNVSLKLYPNARHELLSEPLVRDQVFRDIITFIENKN